MNTIIKGETGGLLKSESWYTHKNVCACTHIQVIDLLNGKWRKNMKLLLTSHIWTSTENYMKLYPMNNSHRWLYTIIISRSFILCCSEQVVHVIHHQPNKRWIFFFYNFNKAWYRLLLWTCKLTTHKILCKKIPDSTTFDSLWPEISNCLYPSMFSMRRTRNQKFIST